MSDTFDHEADAYDSLHEHGFQNCWGGPRTKSAPFSADPLYYHNCTTFIAIEKETDKAYLLITNYGDYWVPKALCKQMQRRIGEVYIWDRFEPRYVVVKQNPFTEDNSDD